MRRTATVANIVTLLSLIYLLTSCKSLEEKCIERFPMTVQTEVRLDTLTDTLILPDVIVEYVDTTYCPPALADTLIITKPVKRFIKGDTVVRTVIHTDTVRVLRDDKRLGYLETELQQTQTKLREAKRGYPLLSGIARILMLLIVLAAMSLIARVLGLFD